MYEKVSFQQLIEDSGILGSRPPSSRGWRELKCAVCNDYKYRAGFLFEPEGARYHCFNCGLAATYHNSHTRFSTNMTSVLDAYGIDKQLAKRVLFTGFSVKEIQETKAIPPEARPATPINLPSTFIAFDKTKHLRAAEYLRSRKLTPTEAYVDLTNPDWKQRIIFPVRNRSNELVFFQGRTFTGNRLRWKSPDVPKTGVMFNHSMLYDRSLTDVIVHEGIPDALSVPGVSTLGSEFSQYHVAELTKAPMRKIIVPNKDPNGIAFAKQAIDLGFTISFPDIGDCGDVNSAVIEYGRLYVENEIYTKLAVGEVAEMKLSMWSL